MSFAAIELMVREHNRRGEERQASLARQAGATLRSFNMTADELNRYQSVIEGVEQRFARLIARKPKMRKPFR